MATAIGSSHMMKNTKIRNQSKTRLKIMKNENLQFNDIKILKVLLVTICLSLFLIALDTFAIDRRQEQFKSESSYLVLPMPVVVSGIGEMVVFTGMAANIADSYVDLAALHVMGDAEGTMLWLSDLHWISETLILDTDRTKVSKLASDNYSDP